MDIILKSEKLSVGYGGQSLIDSIDISVRRGEILVLIGPNGAGKSTILKTLSKQIESVAGSVYLDDRDMRVLKESDISKQMSLLMTKHPSPEYMSVEEMVATGRYPYTGRFGVLSDEDKKVVADTIRITDIEEIRDNDFNRISDGQRQRVMLARALCQEPEVLIMDEPTSFLDIHHKIKLLSILKRMVREKNIAVIMSLHELDLAIKCADKVICVANGQIDRYGTVDEIFGNERTDKNGTGDESIVDGENCLYNNYIEQLYGVESGTFINEYGSVELEKIVGQPEVFVIGGGGSAIPLYRRLQREGIPFAAGVIHKNDLEYPVAKALASVVIEQGSFDRIEDENIKRAKDIISACSKVYCTVEKWGEMNMKNKELAEFAGEKMQTEKLGLQER
ncbi:MAG: ABC transporter ATP-binding protein [Lachnospiraceae bacterium]|nr:ABC transporter ATP-binding protein [Lachnospiraceae bacterium]